MTTSVSKFVKVMLGGTLLVSFVIMAAAEASLGFVLGQRALEPLCRAVGGVRVLGNPTSRCVTRLCYRFGNCLARAIPTKNAEELKPGDSESRVWQWLGEPRSMSDDTFEWPCGKYFEGHITGRIRDGRLVLLETKSCEYRGP